MKFFAILLFAALLFTGSKAFSQSATTIQDILETVNKQVVELEEQRNQEVVNLTIDLLVNTGKKTVWRYLDPTFDYDVLVLGDRRVKGLKLTVYKKNSQSGEWTFVDEFTDEKPLIRIDPQEFEQYEFTVSVSEFRPGDATCHFAFILYHQNPERGK